MTEFTSIQKLHEGGIVKICIDSGDCQKTIEKKFLTCGTDGKIMVWTEQALLGISSPEVANIGDSTSSCIAWMGNNICLGYRIYDLISGVEQNLVGRVSPSDYTRISELFSVQLEATCVDVTDSLVVAGASDFSIKLAKIGESVESITRMEIDSEPLSLKFDPNAEFVAVSSLNGAVSILSTTNLEHITDIKDIFLHFGAVDVKNPLCQLSWSKSGSELFVPAKGAVKSFKRDGWKANESFKVQGCENEVFSTSAVSPCGKYLASSTMKNKICLWEISSRCHILTKNYERNTSGTTVITSLEFSPFKASDLIIADSDDGICTLKEAVPSLSISSQENVLESDPEDDEVILNRSSVIRAPLEEMEEDSRMSCDLGAIKKRYGFDKIGTNELEEYGFHSVARDGFPSEEGTGSGTNNSKFNDAPLNFYSKAEFKMKSIPSNFVSGSSPSDSSQKYLKWNRFGCIRSCVNSREKTKSIEIEFHDATIHPEIVIDNGETIYQLGDISNCAVALASMEDKEKEKKMKNCEELEEVEVQGTSEMLVLHVGTWDSESRRWKITLPRGDGAIDVLVTSSLVAAITCKRNVRIFTLTGIQRQIVTHPGPILTATAYQNSIAIASVTGTFAEGVTQDQYQHVIHVYEMNSNNWYRNLASSTSVGGVATYGLPVPKGEKLEWMSYTTNGNLAVMNSDYTVSVRAPCGMWMPIFDGSSSVRAQSDAIWPISVVETPSHQIRYVYCRGQKYPIVSLKPTPTISQWRLPLCNPDSDKSKLEEDLLLNELRQSDALANDTTKLENLQKSQLATIVKMFALACKSDRDSRAAELANLVTSAKGIQLLCDYASKNRKTTLSEKVAAIGREKVWMTSVAAEKLTSRTQDLNEVLRPSRISLNRNRSSITRKDDLSVLSTQSFVDNDFSSSIVRSVSVKESRIVNSAEEDVGDDLFDDDDVPDSQASHVDSTLNESMLSNVTHIPMERVGRNPFKRDLGTSIESQMDVSISVFDQLEMVPDCKRRREEETQKTAPTKKQVKLSFNVASQREKENTVETVKQSGPTPYSLWLEANEPSLRQVFSGEFADFSKFCVQSFRTLSAAEKKDWKLRVEQYK